MILRRMLCALLAAALIGAGTPAAVVTAQILDYEKGFLFFTTGDGFRVAPDVTIAGGQPQARKYARVTFDASGTVTRIEVSSAKLPPEGDLDAVRKFALTLSTPAPNPDLVPSPNPGRCASVKAGKLVTIAITVQVPPSTGATDRVYMTTDQSGWNAQAYPLDRVDVLHYRTILKLYSGTVMHVLMDRGSTQSIQVGENGIDVKPFLLCIGDEDVQAFHVTVYRWGDEGTGPAQSIPQSIPTPFNPSPFQTPPPL